MQSGNQAIRRGNQLSSARRAVHTPSSSEPSEAVQHSTLALNLEINLNLDLDLTCEMPETKHSPWYVWLSTRTTPKGPNEQRELSIMLRCTNCGVECMYPWGRQSVAISGNKWQSVVISGNQWQSVPITCGVECMYPTGGKPCVRLVPAIYEADSSYLMRKSISGHQRSSAVISGHQRSSLPDRISALLLVPATNGRPEQL